MERRGSKDLSQTLTARSQGHRTSLCRAELGHVVISVDIWR